MADVQMVPVRSRQEIRALLAHRIDTLREMQEEIQMLVKEIRILNQKLEELHDNATKEV